jgi:hypothetical protein
MEELLFKAGEPATNTFWQGGFPWGGIPMLGNGVEMGPASVETLHMSPGEITVPF